LECFVFVGGAKKRTRGSGYQGEKEKPQLSIDLTLCPQDWVPEATNERIRFTARIYTYNKDNGEWEFKGDGGEKRKITFFSTRANSLDKEGI